MIMSNGTSPIRNWKTTNFVCPTRFPFQPVRTRRYIFFFFATLFWGRKHRDKFNFFSDSKLGCGPQDSIGKFTYICYFKRVEKTRKTWQKKRAIILIAREVCVVLSVVVAKAPYIHEIDSSILVYPNSYEKRRKSIRIHWTNCLHYKTLRIYKASHLL